MTSLICFGMESEENFWPKAYWKKRIKNQKRTLSSLSKRQSSNQPQHLLLSQVKCIHIRQTGVPTYDRINSLPPLYSLFYVRSAVRDATLFSMKKICGYLFCLRMHCMLYSQRSILPLPVQRSDCRTAPRKYWAPRLRGNRRNSSPVVSHNSPDCMWQYPRWK